MRTVERLTVSWAACSIALTDAKQIVHGTGKVVIYRDREGAVTDVKRRGAFACLDQNRLSTRSPGRMYIMQ